MKKEYVSIDKDNLFIGAFFVFAIIQSIRSQVIWNGTASILETLLILVVYIFFVSIMILIVREKSPRTSYPKIALCLGIAKLASNVLYLLPAVLGAFWAGQYGISDEKIIADWVSEIGKTVENIDLAVDVASIILSPICLAKVFFREAKGNA